MTRKLVEEPPRVRASPGGIDVDVAAASMQGTLAELGRMIQVGVVAGPASRWTSGGRTPGGRSPTFGSPPACGATGTTRPISLPTGDTTGG